jgi:hypothetical protein
VRYPLVAVRTSGERIGIGDVECAGRDGVGNRLRYLR